MFSDEPFTKRDAWAWLIAEAAWKVRRKRVGRVIFNLERGQLVVSERFMAEAWGWKRSKVHRFLNSLKIEQMIEPLANHDATIITICNYDKYQFVSEHSEPRTEPPIGPPADHRRTKLEEINNLNNVIEREIEGDSSSSSVPRKKGTKASLVLENPDFQRFWNQYPKQVDIGNARKLYDRIVFEGMATPAELIAGAMRYSAERSGQEDRFTKSPVNWLTGECWRDSSEARSASPRAPSQKSKADSAIDGMMSYFHERNET